MQRRKRKTVLNSDVRTVTAIASACFKVVSTSFTLIALLVFSGCAGKKTSPTFDLTRPNEAMNKAFASTCISGEGKGILHAGEKKHSFRFATRSDMNSWILGISLPLLGEEILQLDYSPFQASGGIYEYLQSQMTKKQVSPVLLDQKLQALAQFLGTWQKVRSGAVSCAGGADGAKIIGKCQQVQFKLAADTLEFSRQIAGDVLTANFSQYNGSYFESLEMKVGDAHPFALNLKYAQCH